MGNLFDLSGRNALVTGGRGLAAGMARGLRDAGAQVTLLTRSEPEERDFARHIVLCDLADRAALANGFAEALAAMDGKIDILVNCAGIQRRRACEDFSLEDWDDVLEVNLTASFELCQLAGREMLKAGRGKIINIASMLSFFGGMRIPAYAASKGGVAQMTKALAVAWAGRGVNVNALAPGYMDTEMNSALLADADRRESILARIPAGRWGDKADMAGPCVFLASAASDYLSGAVIPVDGGYLCC